MVSAIKFIICSFNSFSLAVQRLNPRPYQVEAAQVAIERNTIINIKTGGGKTLIAVLVIDHFLTVYNSKKVIFIVPSRALVAQQAEYIRNNCKPLVNNTLVSVAELCGQEMDSWTQDLWNDVLRKNCVFVGTPEIFRRAFVDQGFLTPASFSLIVFDECHNAKGNSPMAAIMRDAILKVNISQRPRILGLTASFVNGSLKNIIEQRKKLETLLQSNIISPIIPENTAVSDKLFHNVRIPYENLLPYEEYIKQYTNQILSTIPSHLFDDKEKNRWILRAVVVFHGLGIDGLIFWLKECIIQQLDAEAEELINRPEVTCRNKAQMMKNSLSYMRNRLEQANYTFNSLPNNMNLPIQSQKLLSLLELLWRLYQQSDLSQQLSNTSSNILTAIVTNGNNSSSNPYRGIVFVEQVALTYPLSYCVNKYFASKINLNAITSDTNMIEVGLGGNLLWPMVPISGTGSMLDSTRTNHLDKFRTGLVPLLVSTTALEEGIDVPECRFVVRYDLVRTTKAHIQGSGRARCPKAEVFYFENEAQVECQKAATLEAVASDSRLNLTMKQLRDELVISETPAAAANAPTVGNTAKRPVHPFYLSSNSTSTAQTLTTQNGIQNNDTNQVNFFNCIQIFYEYVQRVMKQSLEPEYHLYRTKEEIVCTFPLETKRTIVSVSYPTPTGIKAVQSNEVEKFWSGYKVEDIVSPKDRLKNMDAWDLTKRRFVYVVVIKMHQQNLLTSYNQPTPDALATTRLVCPPYIMAPRLNIKNTMKDDSLKFAHATGPF